jgi:N-acetylglutamate synthase-like GNAT family acetyltransferase
MDLWRTALTITPEYLSAHAGLVAVENDRPVGCCVLELRKNEGSLEHLWMEPECHGRGIGRMLVAQALAIASRAGVPRVVVIADPFAEGFYLKLGAVRTGKVPAPMPGAPDRMLPLLEFAVQPE